MEREQCGGRHPRKVGNRGKAAAAIPISGNEKTPGVAEGFMVGDTRLELMTSSV